MQNNDCKTQNDRKEREATWKRCKATGMRDENDHIKMLNNYRDPKLPNKMQINYKNTNQPQWDVKRTNTKSHKMSTKSYSYHILSLLTC